MTKAECALHMIKKEREQNNTNTLEADKTFDRLKKSVH